MKMKTAKMFVEQALKWKGKNESDGSHKEIIDVYNSQKTLPRNYKVKYTDAWCATFVSAVSVKLGFTDILPPECSCEQMINLHKKMGTWIEDENRTPNVGDICFYDWGDGNAKNQNVGWCDHVGIVIDVSRETFTVLEGNYSNSVKERTVEINGRYLRGFAVPKYDKEVSQPSDKVKIEMPILRKGSKGSEVKTLQKLLIIEGCSVGKSGVDGRFGSDTEKGVKEYQNKVKLDIDGVVGFNTWSVLLKG